MLAKASPYLTAADFYLGLPNVPFSQYDQSDGAHPGGCYG